MRYQYSVAPRNHLPKKKKKKNTKTQKPLHSKEKESKDLHLLNTHADVVALKQRPTTPLFKLQNKEAHYPAIQTYNKTNHSNLHLDLYIGLRNHNLLICFQ